MWRFVTPPEPFWPPCSWTNINFFLEKQLIKCTYWPLSFCKTLKKFLRLIHSYEIVPFLGRKWPICHEQNFFGTNHDYYFHLHIGPFHCAKFKKHLTADPVMRMCHFWSQNGPFAQNKNFWEIINITLIYY